MPPVEAVQRNSDLMKQFLETYDEAKKNGYLTNGNNSIINGIPNLDMNLPSKNKIEFNPYKAGSYLMYFVIGFLFMAFSMFAVLTFLLL